MKLKSETLFVAAFIGCLIGSAWRPGLWDIAWVFLLGALWF